jgi:hypothetical protein
MIFKGSLRMTYIHAMQEMYLYRIQRLHEFVLNVPAGDLHKII